MWCIGGWVGVGEEGSVIVIVNNLSTEYINIQGHVFNWYV